jgi:hypothetical protein
MAETRFGALKGLRQAATEAPAETPQPSPQPPEPERPQQAGEGEGGVIARRGPGRPGGGKRSNPDYERLNILVRKTTRRKVDMRMLQEPGLAVDLSELVDRLLSEWAG